MQILIYTRLCQVTTLMGASLTSKELNEFMKEADKVISIQIKSTIRGAIYNSPNFKRQKTNCDRDKWWSPMYLSPAFSNISK